MSDSIHAVVGCPDCQRHLALIEAFNQDFLTMSARIADLETQTDRFRAALRNAKTLLCEKYEFEESAALVQLLRETANAPRLPDERSEDRQHADVGGLSPCKTLWTGASDT